MNPLSSALNYCYIRDDASIPDFHSSGLFFVDFVSFQTNSKAIFITDECEKISINPVYGCWDSNPQPSEHESFSTATRPGLPPDILFEMTEFQ